MFSCEFCEIFKNTVSYRTPPVAAFASHNRWMNRPNIMAAIIGVKENVSFCSCVALNFKCKNNLWKIFSTYNLNFWLPLYFIKGMIISNTSDRKNLPNPLQLSEYLFTNIPICLLPGRLVHVWSLALRKNTFSVVVLSFRSLSIFWKLRSKKKKKKKKLKKKKLNRSKF